MGDPKFQRKNYQNPPHPWQLDRIQNENEYLMYYGLKNKKEFWKVRSSLRTIRGQARNLQARLRYGDKQAKIEMDNLINKLKNQGYLVGEELTLDDVLNLTIENILNRRLQTLVYNKGLARSPKQARQFITHGHIKVSDRRINIPGYIVAREEEQDIGYYKHSPLTDELHPERMEEEMESLPIQERMKKDKEKQRYSRRRRRR